MQVSNDVCRCVPVTARRQVTQRRYYCRPELCTATERAPRLACMVVRLVAASIERPNVGAWLKGDALCYQIHVSVVIVCNAAIKRF